MTFQEALEEMRDGAHGLVHISVALALAEQIEANRLAIQELCKSYSELLKTVSELLDS